MKIDNSKKTAMRELLGLEVDIVTTDGVEKAYVAQCDREYGITFHNMQSDKKAYCINKQHFIGYLSRRSDRIRIYHTDFSRCVREILGGRIINDLIINKRTGDIKIVPISRCDDVFSESTPCAFS